MQNISLDQTDRKILDLLQSSPGINATAIGERIGLSQSACWRRIQRLKDTGLIKDFLRAVRTRDRSLLSSGADISLESHLMAFAAEQSRLNGNVVQMDEFRRQARVATN